MHKIIRGTLTAILFWSGAAQAETLADALASGYEASGLIEQNRAALRAADEQVAQSVATLRPVVNWVANYRASWPTETSFLSAAPTFAIGDTTLTLDWALQASITLYDGGAREIAIEVQKENVLATRQQLINVEQQVLQRIVEAYQEIRRVGAFVTLRENNVRVITQELRAAQDRFEVGEITRTDVALAEAQLASARSQLVAEQGALARAVEEFRAAVGRAPDDLAPAAPARIPQSLAEAKSIALSRHPALLELRHRVAAAELSITGAQAALSPTVQLSGQYGVDQDLDDSAGITLSAEGSFYQGGRLASQIREARAGRDEVRGQLLERARTIEQQVGNAYSVLEVARSSRQAFEQQVRAAQIAFEGVREEATLGARTTLDVLDAEQELLDARANVVDAEISEVVASYQLLAAMGMLTVQNLGLNVQIYDPTAYYNLVDDAPAQLSQQGQALDRVLEAIGQGN